MSNPLLSVIILTWNRLEDLKKTLGSIYAQTYQPIEVVLVDSNSTDGTETYIKEHYPGVRYLKLPYNFGVIGGRNIGLANATGDFLMLVDDDAEFLSTDAFTTIIERFQQEPELAATYFRYILQGGEPWGEIIPYLHEGTESEFYSHSFVGCAHCIKATWFMRIGYLKQEFFREGEEQEYSYRIHREGGRILYLPSVVVLHHLNPSQRVHSQHQAFKLAHRSENELTFLKLSDAVLILLWRLTANLPRSIRENWLGGYFQGLLLLLRVLPRITRQRRALKLDRSRNRLLRTLRCYIVQDYETALDLNTSILDWIKVKIRKQPLGVIKDGSVQGLPDPE